MNTFKTLLVIFALLNFFLIKPMSPDDKTVSSDDEIVLKEQYFGLKKPKIYSKQQLATFALQRLMDRDASKDYFHKEVKRLIGEGADSNTQMNAQSVLMFAAYPKYADPDLISFLLQSGANINYKNSLTGTALTKAVSNNNDQLTRLFLEAGADTELQTKWGDTALTLAVRTASQNITELLLKAGANPNAARDGKTPLMQAVELNSPELVLMLLKAGADKAVKSSSQKTALEIANELQTSNPTKDYSEVIKLLSSVVNTKLE